MHWKVNFGIFRITMQWPYFLLVILFNPLMPKGFSYNGVKFTYKIK